MTQCFMSQDWTGPSYPLNTAGGHMSAGPLAVWCGVSGIATPLKKVEKPAFSLHCSHRTWSRALTSLGRESLEEEADQRGSASIFPSTRGHCMKASRARRRSSVKQSPVLQSSHLKAYMSLNFSALPLGGFVLNMIQSLDRSCSFWFVMGISLSLVRLLKRTLGLYCISSHGTLTAASVLPENTSEV